jgi:hypothetical protein
MFTLGLVVGGPGDMDEQVCQGDIHSIADEPADAGGVIPFPCRLNGQRNLRRPAGKSDARQQDGVAERFIPASRTVPPDIRFRYLFPKVSSVMAIYFAANLNTSQALRHWFPIHS